VKFHIRKLILFVYCVNIYRPTRTMLVLKSRKLQVSIKEIKQKRFQ